MFLPLEEGEGVKKSPPNRGRSGILEKFCSGTSSHEPLRTENIITY
jgi:hypothetical protein